jgi:hypothetical protein
MNAGIVRHRSSWSRGVGHVCVEHLGGPISNGAWKHGHNSCRSEEVNQRSIIIRQPIKLHVKCLVKGEIFDISKCEVDGSGGSS